MFRVTFMCSDAKLGPAMSALTGLAIEQPHVQFVANAKVHSSGKVIPRTRGNNLPELVLNKLIEDGVKTVKAPEVRVIVKKLGYSPTSAANVLWRMYQDKKLDRVAPGEYAVRH